MKVGGIEGQTDGCVENGWMDVWLVEWVDGLKVGWLDRWIDNGGLYG